MGLVHNVFLTWTEGLSDSPPQCMEAHLVLLNGYLAFTAWLEMQFIQPAPYWRDLELFPPFSQNNGEPPLDILPGAC